MWSTDSEIPLQLEAQRKTVEGRINVEVSFDVPKYNSGYFVHSEEAFDSMLKDRIDRVMAELSQMGIHTNEERIEDLEISRSNRPTLPRSVLQPSEIERITLKFFSIPANSEVTLNANKTPPQETTRAFSFEDV